MKTLLTLFGAVVLSLVVAGCDQHKDSPRVSTTATVESKPAPSPAPALPQSQGLPASVLPPVAPPATDPIAPAVDQLRGLSYDARGSVSGAVASMDRQIDAQLAQWKSEGRQFSTTAEEQLSQARVNAREKADACTLATSETWNTARDNVVAALDHLRGALHDVETSRKDQ